MCRAAAQTTKRERRIRPEELISEEKNRRLLGIPPEDEEAPYEESMVEADELGASRHLGCLHRQGVHGRG
jgi:hypothetical protein